MLGQDMVAVVSLFLDSLCDSQTCAFLMRTPPPTRVMEIGAGEGVSARVLIPGPASVKAELQRN